MKSKKYLLSILCLASLSLQAEQWNCPKRIVPGSKEDDSTPTRMISMVEMSTNGIGTRFLPPRVPVILVNFANYSFSTSKEHADSIFNATTPIKTDMGIGYQHEIISHGSVASYFSDQSLGQYRPKFDMIGPVNLKNNYEYYGAGAYASGHAGEMISEACTLVNDSMDFSQYDSNKDGSIDLVFVFFAGFGENDRDGIDAGFGINKDGLVWPHYSTTSGGPFDGKYLSAYECCNELDGYLSKPAFLVPAGSGVLVHEYSHGMGLPDVYDKQQTRYMGTWDLMDYGCYNKETFIPAAYNGYQRWFCGWSEPKMMNEAKNDTLRSITSSGDFGVITTSGKINGPHNDNTEYWIIENRQLEGWDMWADGEGLIVYHMRHHNGWGSGANANDSTDGCILLPADDTLRVQGWVGKQEDCYPYLSKDSIVLSKAPNYPITEIKQEVNGDITFKVCGGEKPTGLDEKAIGDRRQAIGREGEKVVVNGTMYIRRGDKLYTLTGNETHIL